MVKIITIREQVYEVIKLRIANGTYRHGMHLQEISLAEDLNVSRSPVREALKQLTSEELLVSAANKGSYVREFTKKELQDIFDFRIIIEIAAIQFLQKHPEKVPVQKLKQVKSNILRLEPDDIDYAISDNTNPHYTIVEATENEYVIRRHRQASYCTMSFHSILFDGGNYEESVQAHTDLIDSVLDADFERAIQVLQAHLIASQECIFKAIRAF